jgi:hypothetical protein
LPSEGSADLNGGVVCDLNGGVVCDLNGGVVCDLAKVFPLHGFTADLEAPFFRSQCYDQCFRPFASKMAFFFQTNDIIHFSALTYSIVSKKCQLFLQIF